MGNAIAEFDASDIGQQCQELLKKGTQETEAEGKAKTRSRRSSSTSGNMLRAGLDAIHAGGGRRRGSMSPPKPGSEAAARHGRRSSLGPRRSSLSPDAKEAADDVQAQGARRGSVGGATRRGSMTSVATKKESSPSRRGSGSSGHLSWLREAYPDTRERVLPRAMPQGSQPAYEAVMETIPSPATGQLGPGVTRRRASMIGDQNVFRSGMCSFPTTGIDNDVGAAK